MQTNISSLEKFLCALRGGWSTYRVVMLRVAVGALALYATAKLGDEFRRLLFETGHDGAIDLRILHTETNAWFAGRSVYQEFDRAPHPPASFVILYPALGWLDFSGARWLWATVLVAALGWLIGLAIHASNATTQLERFLVALILLALNATGVTIGNGQQILFVLPMLLTALLVLPARTDWRRDLLGAALVMPALVKPSISVPFLWLVLFIPGRILPLFFVICFYLALTLVGVAFQPAGIGVLSEMVSRGSIFVSNWSYANLTTWLADLGWIRLSLPGSFVVLGLYGVWIYLHRRADFWTLVGTSALVARMWIYHLVYDDVLIFLAMLALFRIAKRDPNENWSTLSGALLAINICAMLFLARWQFSPPPLNWLFIWGHTFVWIADLIFLVWSAGKPQTHLSEGLAFDKLRPFVGGADVVQFAAGQVGTIEGDSHRHMSSVYDARLLGHGKMVP